MTRRFSKSDLCYEAAQVKRKILNDARHGRLLIAPRPRLGLTSDRALWNGDSRKYLDVWYTNLLGEVDQILHLTSRETLDTQQSCSETDDKSMTLATGVPLADQLQKLEQEITKQRALIRAQQQMIEMLRIENEELRLTKIVRHGKIDA
jgi:hypothetical protein